MSRNVSQGALLIIHHSSCIAVQISSPPVSRSSPSSTPFSLANLISHSLMHLHNRKRCAPRSMSLRAQLCKQYALSCPLLSTHVSSSLACTHIQHIPLFLSSPNARATLFSLQRQNCHHLRRAPKSPSPQRHSHVHARLQLTPRPPSLECAVHSAHHTAARSNQLSCAHSCARRICNNTLFFPSLSLTCSLACLACAPLCHTFCFFVGSRFVAML